MRERLLVLGAPGTGKTKTIADVCAYAGQQGKRMYVIDVEDKIEAMMSCLGGTPKNMDLHVATEWVEIKGARDKILQSCKPEEWIAIDRADLCWPNVQRWYVQEVYGEDLATVMVDKAKKATNKNSMLAQRFDGGGWQRINEEYETFINAILYKSRCNVLMTAGIKDVEEGSPKDIFGNLKVGPRGQKELQHQPHSVFLLTMEKQGKGESYFVTTGKDLPGRAYFDNEPLFDFSAQYLGQYS